MSVPAMDDATPITTALGQLGLPPMHAAKISTYGDLLAQSNLHTVGDLRQFPSEQISEMLNHYIIPLVVQGKIAALLSQSPPQPPQQPQQQQPNYTQGYAAGGPPPGFQQSQAYGSGYGAPQQPAGGYQQPAAGGYHQQPAGGYQQPPGGYDAAAQQQLQPQQQQQYEGQPGGPLQGAQPGYGGAPGIPQPSAGYGAGAPQQFGAQQTQYGQPVGPPQYPNQPTQWNMPGQFDPNMQGYATPQSSGGYGMAPSGAYGTQAWGGNLGFSGGYSAPPSAGYAQSLPPSYGYAQGMQPMQPGMQPGMQAMQPGMPPMQPGMQPGMPPGAEQQGAPTGGQPAGRCTKCGALEAYVGELCKKCFMEGVGIKICTRCKAEPASHLGENAMCTTCSSLPPPDLPDHPSTFSTGPPAGLPHVQLQLPSVQLTQPQHIQDPGAMNIPGGSSGADLGMPGAYSGLTGASATPPSAAPVAGRCIKCRQNTPNANKRWCEWCYQASIGKPVCHQCWSAFATPGSKRCAACAARPQEPCPAPHVTFDEAKCTNCKMNTPNPGRKWCQACFEASRRKAGP